MGANESRSASTERHGSTTQREYTTAASGRALPHWVANGLCIDEMALVIQTGIDGYPHPVGEEPAFKAGEMISKEYARWGAAAPDLLAACEEALGVMEEPGMMDFDEWKAWMKRAMNACSLAIAKAEGREVPS